jgi:hypothetical protein
MYLAFILIAALTAAPGPEETLCRLLWAPQTPRSARDAFLVEAEALLAQGQPGKAADSLDRGLADLLTQLQTSFSSEATTWRQGRRALDQELGATGPAAIRGDLLTLKPWALIRAQRLYCLTGREARAFHLADAAQRDWGGREHLVNRLLLALRFGRLDEAERLTPEAPSGYRETAAAAWLACRRGGRREALAQDLYRAARLCGDETARQGLELMEEKCRP